MPLTDLKSGSFLKIIVILECLVYGVVFLEIPIAGQVIGFVYLTFIPGIVVLKILKLDNLDFAEEILISAGLSIAFLMFTGLMINQLYPLIGVLKPLSLGPFLLTMNFVLLLLCVVDYFRETNPDKFTSCSRENLCLSYPLLFSIFSLLLLSLLGTIMINNSQGNSFLLTVIVIISALVFFSALSERLVPSRSYPLLLFAIGLALLCFVNASLITRYIVGWDVHSEFYAFELTKNSGRWASAPLLFDPAVNKGLATLSVTILPTIYSQTLGLDGTWIFKVIYPLITVFVSLGLYKLYCAQTGKKTAILATFFFITVSMSYGWGSNKQIVAQLFYVLLFFITFKSEIPSFQRNIFFMIFSFALVTSHYSLSYIFMLTIFFAWIFLSLRKNPYSKISVTFVTLFFTLAFSWYIFVSSGVAFGSLIESFTTVGTNFFTEFFNPKTRGTEVLSGVGATAAESFLHQIGRFFFYVTEFLVVVGFAKVVHALVIKRNVMSLDLEYIALIGANMAVLLMAIVAPNLAKSFLMERFYQTTLLIIAPLCILGGSIVFGYFSRPILRHWPSIDSDKALATIITLGVLIPNFLFNVGFIYEVSGDQSWSIPLSLYRMKNQIWLYDNIVTEEEVLGAKWLSNHVNITNVLVYSDYTSRYHVLLSYGMVNTEHVQVLSNTTKTVDNRAFVYLRYVNIVYKKMEGENLLQWNISEISSLIENQNKVYSNGGCEIFRGLPFNKTITTQG